MEQKKFLDVVRESAKTLEGLIGEDCAYMIIAKDEADVFGDIRGGGFSVVEMLADALHKSSDLKLIVESSLSLSEYIGEYLENKE